MAVLPPFKPSRTSESWLDLSATWIRSLSMSDWIKSALTAAGSVAVVWNMVQQHEYRLAKIEVGFEKHLESHDADLEEIRQSLNVIDLKLTRMEIQGTNGH